MCLKLEKSAVDSIAVLVMYLLPTAHPACSAMTVHAVFVARSEYNAVNKYSLQTGELGVEQSFPPLYPPVSVSKNRTCTQRGDPSTIMSLRFVNRWPIPADHSIQHTLLLLIQDREAGDFCTRINISVARSMFSRNTAMQACCVWVLDMVGHIWRRR